MTRGVHHLDLVVSSIERSLPFYRELLDPLGYTRMGEVQGERGETIWYIAGAGTVVGVREAQTPDSYDRYRVGVHHVARRKLDRRRPVPRHQLPLLSRRTSQPEPASGRDRATRTWRSARVAVAPESSDEAVCVFMVRALARPEDAADA